MILAQSNPGATTLTDAYTVPAGRESVISTITVCNRDPAQTNCRVSVAKAGEADDNKQYIFYDLPVPGNDTFGATIGLCLGPLDVVRVWALVATLSFTITGIERPES